MNIQNRSGSLLPRILLASVALVSVVACTDAKATKTNHAPSAPTVYFVDISRRDLPLYIETVGSLDGYVNADIRARVRGFLQTQSYKDGAFVKAGQTLFSIEATEYVAARASANANLTRAKVAVAKNKVELERDQGLFNTGMLSRQELDNATASVADAEGQVQAAQAQLTQAQLSLSYTQMRSPISGVAGLALVRVGNLVGQDGPTLLTTVSRLDPVRVNFPISEVEYVRYPERFKHLEASDLAWAKKQFSSLAAGRTADNGDTGVELVLSDGSTYSHRGVIVTVNRQVDPSTGTLQVQALVPNPDLVLRPGQYVHVRMRRQDAGNNVLLVPEKALISVQGSYSVAVIGPDNLVHLRRVELGPNAEGQRVVISGVAEGDRIVVEGVQKASEGTLVNAVPAPPTTVKPPSANTPSGSASSEPAATAAAATKISPPAPASPPNAH